MELLWFVALPIVIFFALVIRWAMRWRDPSTSSTEKQAEARLWSTKNTSVR
jgi:hypothetical protein